MTSEELRKCIRDIPNFPKKGIVFKDISTLLNDKKAFKNLILYCPFSLSNFITQF